jgi:hypothetical protein
MVPDAASFKPYEALKRDFSFQVVKDGRSHLRSVMVNQGCCELGFRLMKSDLSLIIIPRTTVLGIGELVCLCQTLISAVLT